MFGCTKHSGLSTAGNCGQCGLGYCEDCLVFPFGQKKPPMCVGCALSFAGVRHKGQHRARPQREKLSWSERRRRKARPSVPTVPTVSVADSALGTEDFGPAAVEPEPFVATTYSTEGFSASDDGEREFSLDDLFAEPLEHNTSPSMHSAEGIEAMIAVPLPRREVTADR